MLDEPIRPTPVPAYVPPPIPPAPPKVETPEQAIQQAEHDLGGQLFGASHADTQANLLQSRDAAIERALTDGRSGDVRAISDAYDQAQARLDARNVAHEYKPEAPTSTRAVQTPTGDPARESTYADGTRIVQVEGRDANGNPVATTQVFPPTTSGASAEVPIESRAVVANGVSTTSGLPAREINEAPDGSGTIVTDTYGDADNPQRVVQHMVIRNGDQGTQVQSVTVRADGVDLGTPQPLRIRELSPDGSVRLDTGEVSGTSTVPVPGQPGVSTVTHQYDSGYRMEYRVHAAPEGVDNVPDALLSQKLVDADGNVAFQRDGVRREETVAPDFTRTITDTAQDGGRTSYTIGSDGRLASSQVVAPDGLIQQSTQFEQVEGLPVVTSRTTVTHADGTQVVTEYDESNQPVGIRRLAADGSTLEQLGSLDGERIASGSADDIASEILDVGKKTMWKDDYEKRLGYALERLQVMDPVSQQQVLESLQSQDEGMADSWFKTDILENLGSDQLRGLEDGGLDILTGVQGTTAIDIEQARDIHDIDVDAGQYTGEYGELAATSEEQHAGQLEAFTAEYRSRAADPASQQRFLAVYQRMHGDDAIEGFLSDENLANALDGGVSLYQGAGTVSIDRPLYETLMGDRLETSADGRADVLAARDRVMDTGVRRMWTDDYEARVRSLATEMQGLDAEGQAALVRQIVKEDPDARLSWLRDGSLAGGTEGNDAFTPEMRELVTGIRGNGDTTFGAQLLGFGSGVKNAAWGFVVGIGALARTAYDLGPAGVVTDLVSGGNAPAWLPSAQRGLETGQAMIEGLPNMFDHIGEAWTQGRYGEALGNVTFDVASLFIPVKIPKVKMPGGAAAVDDIARAGDEFVMRPGAASDDLARGATRTDEPAGAYRDPLADGYRVAPGRFATEVLGTAPSRFDGALLQIAKDVYKGDGTPLPGGFRQVADADLPPGLSASDFNHSSGVRAGIYTNGEGQFVLAFKGTAPFSRTGLKDIYTDGAQGVGLPTPQYAHAADLARRAYAIYGENLVLTGHSLGGGLASHASMAAGAGHVPAVVFNPAGVHPFSLARENPMFRRNADAQQAPDGGTFGGGPGLAAYYAENAGLVRAYITRNDELTITQDMLGPLMPSALGFRQPLPGNFPIGHTMKPVEGAFERRFPDGTTPEFMPNPDIGVWFLEPGTGQWTLRGAAALPIAVDGSLDSRTQGNDGG